MGCWPALAHAAFSFLVFFDLSQPTDRKKFSGFPFPNTTKAQTQMEAPLVGVQGHQKQWGNTEVFMEIDVFVCLVVQEPGVPGGLISTRLNRKRKRELGFWAFGFLVARTAEQPAFEKPNSRLSTAF